MVSVIVGRALMGAVMGLERPLERLEAAFAIWAGEKRGEPRQVVRLDIEVNGREFRAIAENKNIRSALVRAEVMKDMGAVSTCESCGGVR